MKTLLMTAMTIRQTMKVSSSDIKLSPVKVGANINKETKMSELEDSMIDLEVRDYWWEQGEAVMREMLEDD